MKLPTNYACKEMIDVKMGFWYSYTWNYLTVCKKKLALARLKNVFTNHIYLIYMYEENLEFNNRQWLICYKIVPTKQTNKQTNNLMTHTLLYLINWLEVIEIQHCSINTCFIILKSWWRVIKTETFECWLSFPINSSLLYYFVFLFSPYLRFI